MAARLSDICSVGLVARDLCACGASVGLKLLRAGALGGWAAKDVREAAVAGASPAPAPPPPSDAGPKWAELQLLGMPRDCADEVLARLLPWAAPTPLLVCAASRNLAAACVLLIESGGDLHHVEVRRGRKRGLVDMAARAAALDGDWRLVLKLLRLGARPEAPQGVLLTPLRRDDVALARKLLGLGVMPDAGGLASLLCDACSHGATQSAALLVDELGVAANVRNERDGDSGTDRALAWHCWATAEWLVVERGGLPAKPEAALGHLLDAADEPGAARVLAALRSRGSLSHQELLQAAVQRGNLRLCEELLAAMPAGALQATPPSQGGCGQLPFVDLALCHGHLRVALALLRHGVAPWDAMRAREDTRLHGGLCHATAAKVLALLPAPSSSEGAWSSAAAMDEDRTPDAAGASGDTFVGVFDSLAGSCGPKDPAAPTSAFEDLALLPLLQPNDDGDALAVWPLH